MLTAKEIHEKMEKSDIVITPLLDPENQFSSGSIDVRLGVVFILPKNSHIAHFDPVEVSNDKIPIEYFFEKIYRPFSEALVLNPDEMALGATLEYIKLPNNIYGDITGRSSWGRLGIGITTGQIIRPGHKGCLTLELVNHSRSPIKIYPGMRIGQIVFYESKEDFDEFESRYDYAIGPQFSRIWKDVEMVLFKKFIQT